MRRCRSPVKKWGERNVARSKIGKTQRIAIYLSGRAMTGRHAPFFSLSLSDPPSCQNNAASSRAFAEVSNSSHACAIGVSL